MTADECEFEHEGMCLPPDGLKGFVCPDSVPFGECGLMECHGRNEDLMTEEEYDEMVAKREEQQQGL